MNQNEDRKGSAFAPIPLHRRREIEAWLAAHRDALDDAPGTPVGVKHDGTPVYTSPFPPRTVEGLFGRIFRRRPPLDGKRRLDPRQTAELAARLAEGERPFCDELNRWLVAKALDPADVYHAADITKQTWAKLRNVTEPRRPNKATALALTIGFQMTVAEAKEFLAAAGYAFSSALRTDLIVRYFLEQRRWNIHEVNATLVAFGEKSLTAR